MKIRTFYRYLIRSRRDLWAILENLPDEVLSKNMIPAERFRCIKDLLFHIATVEDSWVHEDILRDQPVWEGIEGFPERFDAKYFETESLAWILEYWRAVEASTLGFLEGLQESELTRIVEEQRSVEGLLWHVMQHEVRHTAQIALLIRQQGFKPPALDLLWFLPL
jgi:uncharacterized damage-inducible protein DinB